MDPCLPDGEEAAEGVICFERSGKMENLLGIIIRVSHSLLTMDGGVG